MQLVQTLQLGLTDVKQKNLFYCSLFILNIFPEKEIQTHHSLVHSFKMGTHTGTHLDTPAHIIPGGKTLSDFPLNTKEKFTEIKLKGISS